jgi:hypothetical protein
VFAAFLSDVYDRYAKKDEPTITVAGLDVDQLSYVRGMKHSSLFQCRAP